MKEHPLVEAEKKRVLENPFTFSNSRTICAICGRSGARMILEMGRVRVHSGKCYQEYKNKLISEVKQ